MFPNWFIACDVRCDYPDPNQPDADCCIPSLIKSTTTMTYNRPDFVTPFDSENTFKRFAEDKFRPLTTSVWFSNPMLPGVLYPLSNSIFDLQFKNQD